MLFRSGRGGWSWYSGSAAWLYRAALENLLGLRVHQGELSLSPCVPENWPSFEVTLRLGGQVVTVHWQRGHETSLTPDRTAAAGEVLRLAELPSPALVLVVSEPNAKLDESLNSRAHDEAAAHP